MVLVVTKKRVAETGTNFAQGGIAAVLSKVDDYKNHVKDTLVAGCFHNNRRAVEYMVRHGPAAIRRLIELGVPFATQHGKLLLTREGGHGQRRIAFVSDYTGQAIERVLVSKTKKNPRITLLEHTFAANLLVKNRRCYGIQILRDGAFTNIFGGITVLATGGIGQLYSHTTNPDIATGDGLAMAARAGCKFRDLEFVQFHPTAFSHARKSRFLISEAVRGEGAYLRNSKGERLMLKIHTLAELAPRDIVARAIFEEEKSGPVFLDIRHKPKSFSETRFQQIYRHLKSNGIKMERDLIPISPAAHYSCGGIRVDLRGETGIKNLYAFGEVSGTGVHGANRLASNSLLEALVFSDRILKNKALQPSRIIQFKTPEYENLDAREKKELHKLREELRNAMWNFVGIVRNKTDLQKTLKILKNIESGLNKTHKSNLEAIELNNMIAAAKLITKAALARKKSIGCHYRLG